MFGFILFCVGCIFVYYLMFKSPLRYGMFGKWFYYGGIELHEALSCYSNGKLKSASLWGEETINGATFEWCGVVTFYESGRFACGKLGRNYNYRDIIFKKGTMLYYHDDDKNYVLCGTLAEDYKYNDKVIFRSDSKLYFDEDGNVAMGILAEDYKDSTGRIIHCAGSKYLVCWMSKSRSVEN